jgi:glycosyltransferase involved in cell wall biosynthesis
MTQTKKTLFPFIEYIDPLWYYSLTSDTIKACFVHYNQLSEEDQTCIQFDAQYETTDAALRDAAYQAWANGIVTKPQTDITQTTTIPSVADNYRFVKKYYHPFWSVYILCLRLLMLHNPFTELYGYFKNSRTHRVASTKKVKNYPDYETFQSSLIRQNPKVSIIIPTLNRYVYLKDALVDLEQQTYQNIEVLVVDQSTPFNPTFYETFNLDLKIIYQQEKALWKARNEAVQQSTGEYILLFDDDSRVDPDWVAQHLKCLDYFGADISSGASLSVIGGKIPDHYSFFRWGDQIDTGNALVKKEVFRKVGLFDLKFDGQRMGDGEYGLRSYLNGHININNPFAKRVHLKVKEGGLREMGSWDAFRPTKLFAPRPVPSALYLARKYFGNRSAIYMMCINVPMSLIPYKLKGNKFLIVLSMSIGLLLLPLWMYQIGLSWSRSSKMLNTPSKIPTFNG